VCIQVQGSAGRNRARAGLTVHLLDRGKARAGGAARSGHRPRCTALVASRSLGNTHPSAPTWKLAITDSGRADLLAARIQMAITLGFHIVLARDCDVTMAPLANRG